jgi:hypothetical protein
VSQSSILAQGTINGADSLAIESIQPVGFARRSCRLSLVGHLTGHWLFGPLQQMCSDECTVF